MAKGCDKSKDGGLKNEGRQAERACWDPAQKEVCVTAEKIRMLLRS